MISLSFASLVKAHLKKVLNRSLMIDEVGVETILVKLEARYTLIFSF